MEIALSTTEAEYITLSQSIGDLIPLRTILIKVSRILVFNVTITITHSTVFENNNGAIELDK